MRQLSEVDDRVLILEYRESIKRLESLDPDLPKRMYEIRAKYRDYIGGELLARGLLTAAAAGPTELERDELEGQAPIDN